MQTLSIEKGKEPIKNLKKERYNNLKYLID